MLVAIIMVLLVAIVLGLRQSGHKKTLKANPNDREALIKLFNSCDAPSTYEDAANYGVKYLENNPHDYQIMNLCAYGFSKTKSGPGIRSLLDSRIHELENIVDDPIRLQGFIKQDKDFKVYAKNLFTYYASALLAFKEMERSKYYENKAKSI